MNFKVYTFHVCFPVRLFHFKHAFKKICLLSSSFRSFKAFKFFVKGATLLDLKRKLNSSALTKEQCRQKASKKTSNFALLHSASRETF